MGTQWKAGTNAPRQAIFTSLVGGNGSTQLRGPTLTYPTILSQTAPFPPPTSRIPQQPPPHLPHRTSPPPTNPRSRRLGEHLAHQVFGHPAAALVQLLETRPRGVSRKRSRSPRRAAQNKNKNGGCGPAKEGGIEVLRCSLSLAFSFSPKKEKKKKKKKKKKLYPQQHPGGTLVEPWWNPGGTLVEPWCKFCGTLVELWWNRGGTLVEPYLRAAPDHPGPYLG